MGRNFATTYILSKRAVTMATKFGDKDFDANRYKDYRPTYDESLYNLIYDFHTRNDPQAKFDTAIDLATGTGQAASDLAKKFKEVKAFDNSATMLDAAVSHPQITYAEGSDTNIPVPEQSADVLTVAQAAHWFDWDKFCKEANRVLKPNGTVAVWGYSLLKVDNNKALTDIANDYNVNVMREWWDERRFLLDDHYIDMRLDSYFPLTARIELPNDTMASPIQKRMTVAAFFSYMRTWSAWKNFCEKNPNKPDPLITLEDRVLLELQAQGNKDGRDGLLDVYWPTILLLGKKSATSPVQNLA